MEFGTSVDLGPPLLDMDKKSHVTMDTNNNHNTNHDKALSSNHRYSLESDSGEDTGALNAFENNDIGDDNDGILGNEDNDDDDDHHDDMFGETDESDSETATQKILPDGFGLSQESTGLSEPMIRLNDEEDDKNNDENLESGNHAPAQSTGDFLSNLNSVVKRVSEEHKAKQELIKETSKKRASESKINEEMSSPPQVPSQNQEGGKKFITLKPPDYPSLSEEQVCEKLVDQDVSKGSNVMVDIQNINVDNLNKLQNLDKADPSVRRFFTRPKVTSQEMSEVKVDPDVKAVVDDFLKTNIVGNFIIARTLRENYALFFSWLAAHIQSERNAWAARLRQALEKIEEQRRDSKDSSTLVIETAARLKLLVQSASENMFGLPGKQKRVIKVNNKPAASLNNAVAGGSDLGTDSSKRQGSFYSSYFRKAGRHDNKYQVRKDEFQQRMDALGRMSDRMHQQRPPLTQSSLNMIGVDGSAPNIGAKVNGESSNSNQTGGSNSDSQVVNGKGGSTAISGVDVERGKKVWRGGKRGTNGYHYSDEEYMAVYAGHDNEAEGLVVDYDEDTDWKKLLRDNIEVLTEICESLIRDRLQCLKLMGARRTQVASLEDALTNYIQERNSSGHSKRREIERRLGALERENKSLIDEMTSLQHTLTEKNNDALNLQSQLEKLEKMLTESMASKVNKCVGTDDLELPKPSNKHRKSPHVDEKLSKSPYNNTKTYSKEKRKKKVSDDLRSESKTRLDATVSDYDLTDATMMLEDEGPAPPPSNVIDTLAISSANNSSRPVALREPSLIEISEEKLKTLKQRARKLEDSLHDAIHSMERMNKIPPGEDNMSVTSGTSNSTAASMMGRPRGYHPNQAHSKLWKKATFEVSGSKTARTPHLAITKPDRGCETDRTDRHGAKLGLDTEATSLLKGESLKLSGSESEPPLTHRTVVSHDMNQRTPIPSSLRVSSDRHYVTPVSRNSQNEYVSDDELANQSDHDEEAHQSQPLRSHSEAPSLMKKRRKIISRFRGGGRAMAKCLRCQKLFNTVDNHKLACCYHLKGKERVEHYDQAGRLIRVMYAWKCCNQPQESEGCCYGQHV